MSISNPLANPLFPQVAAVCGALLGASLVALAAAGRRRVLLARWCSWVAIALVYAGAVLAGPAALYVLAVALALQGCREYTRLVDLGSGRWLLLGAAVLLPLVAVAGGSTLLYPALLLLVPAAAASALLAQDVERGPTRSALTLLGLLYLPFCLAHLVLLADRPAVLIGLALSVALADVGGFVAGRAFGRRALAARLSPSKTREGAIGSLAGAALGLALIPTGLPVFAAPLIALAAIGGDLFESLLKRCAGAKDSGAWLPGFGGLLDRIDSLLFALPVAYLLAVLS